MNSNEIYWIVQNYCLEISTWLQLHEIQKIKKGNCTREVTTWDIKRPSEWRTNACYCLSQPYIVPPHTHITYITTGRAKPSADFIVVHILVSLKLLYKHTKRRKLNKYLYVPLENDPLRWAKQFFSISLFFNSHWNYYNNEAGKWFKLPNSKLINNY